MMLTKKKLSFLSLMLIIAIVRASRKKRIRNPKNNA